MATPRRARTETGVRKIPSKPVEALPRIRINDEEKATLLGYKAEQPVKELPATRPHLEVVRPPENLDPQELTREANEAMKAARPLIQSGERSIERTKELLGTPLPPEVEEAIESVGDCMRNFFRKYQQALVIAASIATGSSAIMTGMELRKRNHHETVAAEQTQRPGETQIETTSAVAQEIGAILRSHPPKDSKALDLLIEQHLIERLQRFGQDRTTGQGSDLKTYQSVTRGHLAAQLIAAARGGELTFALGVQPLLRDRISPMELCAYGDNPADAVTQFNAIVRSTADRAERQRRIADALDDVAQIDDDIQNEDVYERFTRRLAVHMTNEEAGSTSGRVAMQNLAGELERGFHQQETDAMHWDRGEGEQAVGHLESIRYELGRIHQAERHFGINASVPVSRIEREIAQAERQQ